MGNLRSTAVATGLACMLAMTCMIKPLPVLAFGDVSYLPLDDYGQHWSIAATMRTQISPYKDESLHSDFIPLLTYSGETLFLAGTKAGIHLYKDDDWRFNLFADYRFASYNDKGNDYLTGMERNDSVDGGFDVTRMTSYGDFTFEAESDISQNHNGQVVSLYWSRRYDHDGWTVLPWVGLSYYSKDYNQYYYGVEADEALDNRPRYKAEESTHFRFGSDIRFNIDNRQFLTLNMEYERLADSIFHSPIVDNRNIFKIGLNYRVQFDEEHGQRTARGYDFLKPKGNPKSVRIAGGYGTDVVLNQIVRGNIEFDSTNPGLLSVFWSRQLSETFFGTNWETWITGGIARRFEGDFQDDFFEYVGAIKFYYSNFPWSDTLMTRFGFAEGMSYAEQIPHMEKVNLEDKNPDTSNLLNYLDISFDVNIGDLFNTRTMQSCFSGFSVHHRSGIFASSDIFGPVNGGSNVNTLYVECLYK